MRRCGRCATYVPDEGFYLGQRWCKTCLKAVSGARLRERRLRNKAHLLAYLVNHPCVDCGEADPVVLEFDHLRDKSATLAELAHEGVTLERLDAEVAKCDVVCAVCHRRRTARRRPPARPVDPYVARNVSFVRAELAASGCVDCGLDDTAVLEFDHRGTKTASVMQLAWRGTSLARIERELTQCEVRCANCHRRRTASEGGHYRYVAQNAPL